MGTVPRKEVTFNFPTEFEDTGELGTKLWNKMMPRMYASTLGLRRSLMVWRKLDLDL